MNPLDIQKEYWNRVAGTKSFSHPLHLEDFVPIHREILDVKTMNGNGASILQMGVRKIGKP